MKCAVVTVVLALSLCVTASRCDPKLQEAAICGNTINGGVVLHKKPVKFAKVRVYSSSGETAWIGKTDKDGTFKTAQLPPGDYRLEISGWGSTTIHLNPEIDKGFRQAPVWNIFAGRQRLRGYNSDHELIKWLSVVEKSPLRSLTNSEHLRLSDRQSPPFSQFSHCLSTSTSRP